MLARRLATEIEDELSELSRLAAEFAARPTGLDSVSLRARGSMLHDFYTGFERIFVRISEELGGVPRGEQWHRELLRDVSLDVPGVRPAVISRALRGSLSEYLRFRHLFRNVYGFVLDADRMRPLEESFSTVHGELVSQIRAFVVWMSGSD